MDIDDTIAAISTPSGRGAISIVRISGRNAIKIIKQIFVPKTKKEFTTPGVYVGKIVDNNKVIDEVVLIVWRAPKSFSGEDLVEINCHGGIIVTNDVLNTVLKKGARLARPGEFTLRAFLNKKIDLAQAEALNNLINAKTEKSKEYALSQLFGKFSQYIENIAEVLKNLLVKIEVSIDHPDEDIEFIKKDEIKKIVENIVNKINHLLSTAQSGKAFNYGVNAVIVGRANVGKSSLFNLLLRKDRAIVSAIPGTTRDIIEDWIDVEGIPVKLIDTAGFKEAFDIIEEIALKKTEEMIKISNIIIAVFDASAELKKEDFKLIEKLNPVKEKSIFVLNKIDLGMHINYEELRKRIKKRILKISALKGTGIEKLESQIKNIIIGKEGLEEEIVITNIRYENLLKKCNEYLEEVLKAVENDVPEEFIASDLRRAIKELEEITGKFTTDDLLNSIFSNFCIGK